MAYLAIDLRPREGCVWSLSHSPYSPLAWPSCSSVALFIWHLFCKTAWNHQPTLALQELFWVLGHLGPSFKSLSISSFPLGPCCLDEADLELGLEQRSRLEGWEGEGAMDNKTGDRLSARGGP